MSIPHAFLPHSFGVKACDAKSWSDDARPEPRWQVVRSVAQWMCRAKAARVFGDCKTALFSKASVHQLVCSGDANVMAFWAAC